jgi:preprotein translocase subunit SecE
VVICELESHAIYTNMNKIIQFVQEAKEELLKVNWPSKKQTLKYTMLVVAVSLAVAGFLGGLDSMFGYILKAYIIK